MLNELNLIPRFGVVSSDMVRTVRLAGRSRVS